MLADALFHPLDLDDVIEVAERTSGAGGVVDLLVAALTDRRVRRDTDIDRYLGRLKSACRQTRRYREAIPVLRRISALNPTRRHEIAAELAFVHGHLKEPAKGIALLESAYAQQLRLPARRRSLEFCLVAEIAATVLGHRTLAREIAALGRFVAPAPPRGPVTTVLPAPRESLVPTHAEGDVASAMPGRPRLTLIRGAAA